MIAAQNALNEMKKMQAFVGEHGGLLPVEERQELEDLLDLYVRGLDTFCKLDKLVSDKKNAEAAKESEKAKPEEVKEEKPTKRRPSRKKAEKPKEEVKEEVKEEPVQVVEEAPELFDDLDDLLG